MAKRAADVAEKWGRRLKAAGADIKAGVDATTENPATAAIAALDKMLARFIEAMNSGKTERGLQRVTLESWKKSMNEVGIGRIASGVDAKGNKKMADFMTEFLPFLESVQGQLANMPDTTFEDSVNRMVAQVRATHEFKRGR